MRRVAWILGFLVRFLAVCAFVFVAFFGCMDFGESEETEGCGLQDLEFCLFPPCEPDPCDGVVCRPDANECTREFCSGGYCRSAPVTNGRSCTYDGLGGVCVNGVCGENLCEDDACDDEPCSEGECDYVDGSCDYSTKQPTGTTCVYGGGLEGVCVNGVCGEDLCQDIACDDEPCDEWLCDYVDGSCDYMQNLPNGTPCVFEGIDGVCVAGACAQEILDQENASVWTGVWMNIQTQNEVGQSFQPSCNNLFRVDVDLVYTGGDGSVTANVLRDGTPITGAHAQTFISQDGWVRLELDSVVDVTLNETLVLRLAHDPAPSSPSPGWKFAEDTYPRGTQLFSEQTQPGDFFFRIYSTSCGTSSADAER